MVENREKSKIFCYFVSMESDEKSFEISRLLCQWYEENKRELPWRQTRDPYRIWLSEVILQQTRIAQGLPYYNSFIRHYPDVKALAAADEDSILRLWQGLGYYSRARHLLEAARSIVSDHGGVFPRRYEDILRLQGIGRYTASAIASFAYDEPRPVLDGNVYRVLARLYDIQANILDSSSEKLFLQLALETMDPRHAAVHNQAMMELGALCCTPASPQCDRCPIAAHCLALASGKVSERPVRISGLKRKTRHFHYLCLYDGHSLYLQQRQDKDIWQHLWEFPLIEDDATDWTALLASHPEIGRWTGRGASLLACRHYRHQLTHQTIQADFYLVRTGTSAGSPSKKAVHIAVNELDKYPVPILVKRFADQLEALIS